MKPQLNSTQGKIIRSLALFLSGEGKYSASAPTDASIVVESVATRPWASLTFAGDRHRIVVRRAGPPVPVGDGAVDLPGRIVAVEAAVWERDGDASRLTLDLLAIRPPPVDRRTEPRAAA